jgi:hypothetical protein
MTASRPPLAVFIGAAFLLALIVGAAIEVPHYAMAYQTMVVTGQ